MFDKEDTERKLTEMGDPLERLSKTIDFEMFRPELEDALLPQKFVDYLNGKGLIFNEGRMIDASFVSVPRQRNTPDENKRIKAGEGGDRADQFDVQHVALRANRQAQPPERLTEKKHSKPLIHTYAQTLKKNEQKACQIEQ